MSGYIFDLGRVRLGLYGARVGQVGPSAALFVGIRPIVGRRRLIEGERK